MTRNQHLRSPVLPWASEEASSGEDSETATLVSFCVVAEKWLTGVINLKKTLHPIKILLYAQMAPSGIYSLFVAT